ncbi:hypothetical protein H0V99_01875 [Candidatus Saccharibacteria bacterium]|nr:hypothetical protein [Candidatus Saccharibacteria bacterium]
MGKRLNEDDKVFDVSKPGKGKIVPTSRPVITSQEVTKDIMVNEPEAQGMKSPSESRRVIQPLSSIAVQSEDGIDAAEAIPVSVMQGKTKTEEASAETTTPTIVPAEPLTNQTEKTSEAEKPEVVEVEAKPEPPKEPEKPSMEQKEANPAASSESATVDAVAEAVGSKKQAAKEAEEQEKRDAAVQELIDNKKYYVQLGHDSRPKKGATYHHQVLTVLLILTMVLVVGAYLAIDAGIIESDFVVPYEFIKE